MARLGQHLDDGTAQPLLTLDGQAAFKLEENDSVFFRKSEHSARIIRSDKRNFYEVLRSKLAWSGEPNA